VFLRGRLIIFHISITIVELWGRMAEGSRKHKVTSRKQLIKRRLEITNNLHSRIASQGAVIE